MCLGGGGELVSLDAIECPVLNVFATKDHLVPPASSCALRGLLSGVKYEEVELPGGHIGIYLNIHPERSLPAVVSRWTREQDPDSVEEPS